MKPIIGNSTRRIVALKLKESTFSSKIYYTMFIMDGVCQKLRDREKTILTIVMIGCSELLKRYWGPDDNRV